MNKIKDRYTHIWAFTLSKKKMKTHSSSVGNEFGKDECSGKFLVNDVSQEVLKKC